MKIAIFHNLSSGGAKRSLFEIVKRLSRRHEIRVYSLSSADHEFCDIRPYVESHQVYPFQAGKLFHSPFGRLNSIIRAFDLVRLRHINEIISNDIKRHEPDLIFVEPCRFENAPSLLRYISEFASIYYCHEPYRILYEDAPPRPYYNGRSKLRHTLDQYDPFLTYFRNYARNNDQLNIQKAGRVFVNSAYTKQQVEKIYHIKAEVNYLGVDTTKFKPLQYVNKSNLILSVGSLTPLKGFDFIIRSIAMMPTSDQPALIIASNFSNTQEYEYLNDLANQNHINVQFLIGINDEKLVELYNSARLTAYTPHREPFGLVALESMACATPVVGVKEGGLLETVRDKFTGCLTPRDEIIFAMALLELLKNPQKSHEYGQNGYQEVLAKWNWDSSVQNIESNLISVTKSISIKAQ